jgi:hypothetical protein
MKCLFAWIALSESSCSPPGPILLKIRRRDPSGFFWPIVPNLMLKAAVFSSADGGGVLLSWPGGSLVFFPGAPLRRFLLWVALYGRFVPRVEVWARTRGAAAVMGCWVVCSPAACGCCIVVELSVPGGLSLGARVGGSMGASTGSLLGSGGCSWVYCLLKGRCTKNWAMPCWVLLCFFDGCCGVVP